jgi:Uma2 family endonuclease
MSVPASRRKTAEDLLALPDDASAEIVDGEIVEKASPSAEHSYAQGGVQTWLGHRFHRKGGGGADRPGGWWILPEVDVELEAHEVYRPDLAGWRRERASERPKGRPVLLRPDWVCEVLSVSNAKHDLVTKFRTYHRARVPHYWIVDPAEETLAVHRWDDRGYLTVLTAKRGETVRAEPFDGVPLPVGILFGDEPPE